MDGKFKTTKACGDLIEATLGMESHCDAEVVSETADETDEDSP
jgi:hypothetical protein